MAGRRRRRCPVRRVDGDGQVTDYTEKIATEITDLYRAVVHSALAGDAESLDLLLQSAASRGYALGYGVNS